MPEVVHSDAWATSLRQQTRGLARGWTVEEARGKVRLKVRPDGQPSESISLPFAWGAASAGDAYVRIRNLYALVQQGYTLKQAAEVAAGKAPKLTEQHDWPGAVERFKEQKVRHGTTIEPATWSAKYAPVLSDAVDLLTGRQPPTTPAELIDRCITRWEPGSRTRQERARNLAQFLRYCVAREQFPPIWQPPLDLKDAIGRKPADAVSRKSDAISDQQVIDLLSSLPDDDTGKRWADAIRLMAELGLRPVELLHIEVKADEKTGDLYWYCNYKKRSGGGVTQPRRLHPWPLIGADGHLERWDLLDRWHNGNIQLPPLGMRNGAAESVANYLDRRDGWKNMKAAMAAKSKRLSCYGFRHGYSLRCHTRGLPTSAIADAMGHSLEVHCRSYTWATEATTSAAFMRAAQMISGRA